MIVFALFGRYNSLKLGPGQIILSPSNQLLLILEIKYTNYKNLSNSDYFRQSESNYSAVIWQELRNFL